MANIDLYKQKLVAIANAIRAKLNEQQTYTLEQMPTKIASIPTGGSEAEIKDNYSICFFPKHFIMDEIPAFANSDIAIATGYSIASISKESS